MEKKELGLRAKLGLYVLMFMLKVISPTTRESEVKDVTDKIMKELDKI